jgi:hypothetical protein
MASVHDFLRDEFPSETEPVPAHTPTPSLPPATDPLSPVEHWVVVSRADADVALDVFAVEDGEAANMDDVAEFVLVRPDSTAIESAPAGVAHDNGAAVAVTLPRRPLSATLWVAAAPLATGLAVGFLLAAGLDGVWSAGSKGQTREGPTPETVTTSPVPTPFAPPPAVAPRKTTPLPSVTGDGPPRDVTAPRAGASAPPATPPIHPREIVADTRTAVAVAPPPPPDIPASVAPVPLAVERTPATFSAHPAPAAPVSPSASVIPVSEESAIAAVLERYRGAASALDAKAVAAVWPTTNMRALERAFGQLNSQELSFAGCVSVVNGANATADCQGAATYVPRVGNRNPRVESREWRFELRKIGDRWVIDRVSAR